MDVTAMLSELDDHGFTDETVAAKVRAIQHAIHDVEGREPWRFLEKSFSTLTWDGTSPTPTNMPSDWRAILRLTLSDGTRLRPARIEELEDVATGNYTGTGLPKIYYEYANVIGLWPQPANGTLAMLRYLQWSPDISSTTVEASIAIPKQFHHLIVSGALWRLYDMEDDTEMASRFESHLENGLAQMRAAMWQRQFDQPDHIIITSPQDYYFDF